MSAEPSTVEASAAKVSEQMKSELHESWYCKNPLYVWDPTVDPQYDFLYNLARIKVCPPSENEETKSCSDISYHFSVDHDLGDSDSSDDFGPFLTKKVRKVIQAEAEKEIEILKKKREEREAKEREAAAAAAAGKPGGTAGQAAATPVGEEQKTTAASGEEKPVAGGEQKPAEGEEQKAVVVVEQIQVVADEEQNEAVKEEGEGEESEEEEEIETDEDKIVVKKGKSKAFHKQLVRGYEADHLFLIDFYRRPWRFSKFDKLLPLKDDEDIEEYVKGQRGIKPKKIRIKKAHAPKESVYVKKTMRTETYRRKFKTRRCVSFYTDSEGENEKKSVNFLLEPEFEVFCDNSTIEPKNYRKRPKLRSGVCKGKREIQPYFM